MQVENGQMRGSSPGLQFQPQAGDEKLYVQFHLYPEYDADKSNSAGRPIYQEVDYVRIMVPGDKDNIVDRKARPSDRGRFPNQYQAFRNGLSQSEVSGTPLSLLTTTVPPILNSAQVEEFKYFNCHTVEHLADLPDAVADKFMGFQLLRSKAKDFVAMSRSNAPFEKMRSELVERDSEIAALKQALKEVGDRMEKMEKAKR